MATNLKQAVAERLKKALEDIPSLRDEPRSSPHFTNWQYSTEATLRHGFGENSPQLSAFKDVRFRPNSLSWGVSRAEQEEINKRIYQAGLGEAEAIIQGILTEIEDFGDQIFGQS